MGTHVTEECQEYWRRWAIWHLMGEIWRMQEILPPSKTGTEQNGNQNGDQKDHARGEVLAAATAPTATHPRPSGPRLPLSPEERHLLVVLRLLGALIPEAHPLAQRPSGPTVVLCRRPPPPAAGTPYVANLDRTGLAAQGQVLDGLPTLATGVVQVMTGFHIAGGIAAMLHGAFRMADPDSSLTRIADACRKALTPDLTVIQESVRAMAPLPDNDRGGLRDALSEAARQITGVDVGALKHQLFPPGTGADQPASPRRTPEARDRKTVDAPAVDDTSRDAGIGLSVESAGRGDEVSGPTAEEIAKYARDHPPRPLKGPHL